MHIEFDGPGGGDGFPMGRPIIWRRWAGLVIALIFLIAMLAYLTGYAKAADMAVQKAPQIVAAAPAPTWTGFYIGPKFGYALSDPFIGPAGGVQAGYDWQINPSFVVGLVGDINAASFNGGANVSPAVAWSARTNWYATENVRLGLPIYSALLYGFAGVAEGGQTMNITGSGAFGSNGVGWDAGGGLEWKVSQTFSIYSQYKFIDIGSVSCSACLAGGTAGLSTKFNPSVWETGINFRF